MRSAAPTRCGGESLIHYTFWTFYTMYSALVAWITYTLYNHFPSVCYHPSHAIGLFHITINFHTSRLAHERPSEQSTKQAISVSGYTDFEDWNFFHWKHCQPVYYVEWGQEKPGTKPLCTPFWPSSCILTKATLLRRCREMMAIKIAAGVGIWQWMQWWWQWMHCLKKKNSNKFYWDQLRCIR